MREMCEGKTPEAREKLKAHPWGEELSAGIHLGWIGGALSPTRTDWSALKKAGAARVETLAMAQGQKKSRIVAWQFD